MPDLEAVLFDLYDTLVWSDWPNHAGYMAGHLGVPEMTVAAAYDHLREDRDGGDFPDAESVMAAVMEYCELEPSPARVRELVRREADLLSQHVILYEDSLPTLRRLRSDGIQTGVVSNCSPTTRPVVDRMGLEDEAGVVVLSCEVGTSKPAPGIFRVALDALGVPAERSMFVDDQSAYLDGAAELGMRTVQITRDRSFGEASEIGAHPRVRDMDELLTLIG